MSGVLLSVKIRDILLEIIGTYTHKDSVPISVSAENIFPHSAEI